MGKVRIIPAHKQRGNSINRSPDEPQSERLRVAAYCRVSTELDLLVSYKEHADDPRIDDIVKDMAEEMGTSNPYPDLLKRMAQ